MSTEIESPTRAETDPSFTMPGLDVDRTDTHGADPASLSIAVVVCAFTMARLDQTRNCLTRLLAAPRVPDELLLVIDNNEELLKVFRAEFGSRVTVLANEGRGLSDGRNTGVRHATSDVVAFIDDDAWPEDDWLEELGKAFEDPSVLGVGGRVEPEWEDPELALPPELNWIVGCTYRGHREDPGPITRPIGANMAVRRSVLLGLGGFSPSFGRRAGMKDSSNEELALFSALSEQHGDGHVHYAPRAVVHHFAPAARCTPTYLRHRSRMEGTSKADVESLFGSRSMQHDRSYVRSTVLPSLVDYSRRGLLKGDRQARRDGLALASSFSITAAAYLARRASSSLRALMPRGEER